MQHRDDRAPRGPRRAHTPWRSPPQFVDTTRRSKASKIELLAPAGSADAFVAAVDAGADAVYCGLNEFNARLRAKNLTVNALARLAPRAHAAGVKVYITVNTLVKQAELPRLLQVLDQLHQLRVDALIVQDLGVVELVRRAFPGLRLHASTQMAIHNSLGVQIAQRLGITRVILARELTLDEISLIRRRSPLELEVFVHGAVCYCLSGNCLASSFLGGQSGNRGRCTQVCRRKFRSGGGSGYYFSPRDLCAVGLVPRLMSMGISSLKIEGRMKGVDYLARVVRAYRGLIDGTLGCTDADAMLARDFGRPKSRLFLDGVVGGARVLDSDSPGTGIALGPILDVTSDSITVASPEPVSRGDYVRVQPQDGFEGRNLRVVSVEVEGSRRRIVVAQGEGTGARIGDLAMLTSRADEPREQPFRTLPHSAPVRIRPFAGRQEGSIGSLLSRRATRVPAESSLLVKIDSLRWVGPAQKEYRGEIIASLDLGELRRLIATTGIDPERWWLSMPQFLSETDIAPWQATLRDARARGFRRWVVPFLGGLALLEHGDRAMTDYQVWCVNRFAVAALRSLGVSGHTRSVEDDYPNLRAIGEQAAAIYVYGRIPLFVSRIEPLVKEGERITDPAGNDFEVVRRGELYYTVSRAPLCLFHKRDKLLSAGISRHIVDLSFTRPDTRLLSDLLASYRLASRVEGSTLFNFKLGLH